MNQPLENITRETCVYKVQALRLTYATEQMEKCRSCPGEYYVSCERYRPMKNTQVPMRTGSLRIMFKRFYDSFISLDSLPHEID